MNIKQLSENLRLLGMHPTEEQLQRASDFEEALYEANSIVNLTRIPKEEFWLRHVLDSLLFQDLIPQGARVLDIGTGPGFPSWPLACFRPDLSVVAVDSSGKMLGFLRQHLLPNLKAEEARAEDWGVREKFEVVTGRALAPLSIQLELSAKACRIGGLIIPMRTSADLQECERLRNNPLDLELVSIEKRTLPVIDAERIFPVFKKVRATDRKFPRKWAEIRKSPI